jgi:hypothetical protein
MLCLGARAQLIDAKKKPVVTPIPDVIRSRRPTLYPRRRIHPSTPGVKATTEAATGNKVYDHLQRPVMINRNIQNTNQGAPIKSSAPGIIIKTLASSVAIQEIAATIGMTPMMSAQQRMVRRRNIS